MDGKELDSIRRAKALSYEKLGLLLGVHRGTIFRWCRQGATIPHLTSIALTEIFKGDNSPPASLKGNPMDLSFPIMRYDHTMPLLEGRVKIDGVELKPVRTNSMVFNDVPELREGDFGLWDLNMGYVLPAIEAGWEIVGLPVFSKRKPVYTYLFCRTDAGIDSPRDLEGKRIGSSSYPTGITIWLQGFLQHRHGVDISKLRWITSSPRRVFPLQKSDPRVDPAEDSKKSPIQRLLDGGVDAIITDISDGKAFRTLEQDPSVKRVFPNYFDEDMRLYRETGIYTTMHQIVMSKKLDRANPELAGKLFTAFEEAKRLAYEDILNDRAGFSVVYLQERLEDQIKQWGDPWKYGIKANKRMIDTYLAYNAEQGITSRKMNVEEFFAAGTLET